MSDNRIIWKDGYVEREVIEIVISSPGMLDVRNIENKIRKLLKSELGNTITHCNMTVGDRDTEILE